MASPKIGVFIAALGVLGILGAVFASKAKAAPKGTPQLPEQERSAEQDADYNDLTDYVTQAAAYIQAGNSKGARQMANKIRNHAWHDANIEAAAMKEANKIDMAAKDIEDYNAAKQTAYNAPGDDYDVGPAFNAALAPLG